MMSGALRPGPYELLRLFLYVVHADAVGEAEDEYSRAHAADPAVVLHEPGFAAPVTRLVGPYGCIVGKIPRNDTP